MGPTQHRLGTGVLSLAATLACLNTVSAQTAPVPTPPGWYSGDTHVHVQQCDTYVNLSVGEVHAAMDVGDLDVAAVQLWASPWTPPDYFLSHYASLVSGIEEPHSNSGKTLQFGVEVSGFPASQFGHVQILNGGDAWFATDALYPGPILDAYPEALTGYAHVSWFERYDPVPYYASTNGAYMAPIDAALGAIDFVETTRVEPDPDLGSITWRGLYYKLLNAGLRVSLAAGSDNSCFITDIGDSRTYAQLGSQPLSFAHWCEAIREGRTSVAAGPNRFLDLEVNGVAIGGQVELVAPGMVDVTTTLSVAPGASDSGSLHILFNGRDVASAPYDLPAGGESTLHAAVPVTTSGWIAARGAPGAHTAAIYVIVGDRPIARTADARYWLIYCDTLSAHIADFGVPTLEAEILDRIRAAREVFEALGACALPPPAGTRPYGQSSPACTGPIAIGLATEPDGSSRFTCVNAPPDAQGLLLLGLVPLPEGLPLLGCSVLVDANFPWLAIPVSAGRSGYASVPNPLPNGRRMQAQFVWVNTPGCGAAGQLSASNGLDVGAP